VCGTKPWFADLANRHHLKTLDDKHFEIDESSGIEDWRYDGLDFLCTNTTVNALAVKLRYRELLARGSCFQTRALLHASGSAESIASPRP